MCVCVYILSICMYECYTRIQPPLSLLFFSLSPLPLPFFFSCVVSFVEQGEGVFVSRQPGVEFVSRVVEGIRELVHLLVLV